LSESFLTKGPITLTINPGSPVPIGTGLPGLMVKVVGPLIKKESEKKTAKSEVVEETNK
jgi:hypothetical protein